MEVTNILIEIDGETKPISELDKKDYEDFLEFIHQLRLAYISVTTRIID